MTLKLKFSFALYLINALVLIALGGRYFFAGELMPYHAETLGIARDSLTAAQSIVIHTLYRAAGAGMFATAITILVLLILPYRDGRIWSRWALSGIGSFYLVLSIYLTLAYQAETTASVPWQGPIVGLVTILIAHFLSSGLGGDLQELEIEGSC